MCLACIAAPTKGRVSQNRFFFLNSFFEASLFKTRIAFAEFGYSHERAARSHQ